MSNDAPLIYVDLVEEPLLSRKQWGIEHGYGQTDPNLTRAYQMYCDRFQPWHVAIKSGDNNESLFRSTERYFNEADARHAADLAFGAGSNVYLRQAEHGNIALRLANRYDFSNIADTADVLEQIADAAEQAETPDDDPDVA